jgi:plasmid stabilization system protein ParE
MRKFGHGCYASLMASSERLSQSRAALCGSSGVLARWRILPGSSATSPPTIPVAARRAGRELLLAGDSLVTFPHRGWPGREPSTRELGALQPYIIIYRIAPDDMVTIVRISLPRDGFLKMLELFETFGHSFIKSFVKRHCS